MVGGDMDQIHIKQERSARRSWNLSRRRDAYHDVLANRFAKLSEAPTLQRRDKHSGGLVSMQNSIGTHKHASCKVRASRIRQCRYRRHVSPHGAVRAATRTRLSHSAIEVDADMPTISGAGIKTDTRNHGVPKLRVSPALRASMSLEVSNVSTCDELSDIDDVLEMSSGAHSLMANSSERSACDDLVYADHFSIDSETSVLTHNESEHSSATSLPVLERDMQIGHKVTERTSDEALVERARPMAEADKEASATNEQLAPVELHTVVAEQENVVNGDRSRLQAKAKVTTVHAVQVETEDSTVRAVADARTLKGAAEIEVKGILDTALSKTCAMEANAEFETVCIGARALEDLNAFRKVETTEISAVGAQRQALVPKLLQGAATESHDVISHDVEIECVRCDTHRRARRDLVSRKASVKVREQMDERNKAFSMSGEPEREAELRTSQENVLVSWKQLMKLERQRSTKMRKQLRISHLHDRDVRSALEATVRASDDTFSEQTLLAVKAAESNRVGSIDEAGEGKTTLGEERSRMHTWAESVKKHDINEAETKRRVEAERLHEEGGGDHISGPPETNELAADAAHRFIWDFSGARSRGEEQVHTMEATPVHATVAQVCTMTDGGTAALISKHANRVAATHATTAQTEVWEVLDEFGSPIGVVLDIFEVSSISDFETTSEHFPGWAIVA
eukprot:TRINITY_DN67997_c0_g1_i1.p1 TRINITY_DN67997_c0_g1~~TRINITY_DN67997_c0_g1_i1.p1  ORF type:complete len:684 (+),score=105.09 TRINITY_DN67997_c0_g1_i1:78-2129(+)